MRDESTGVVRMTLRGADLRVLCSLCVGVFLAMLPFMAPAPFLPAMARDLGVGVPLLGSVVAAMLLLSAAIGLVSGPLADRYGHHHLIVLGLVAAGTCLLIFGLAPAFPYLLIAALIGGFGDAAIFGPSFAVAGTYFAGPGARQALSWVTGSMAATAIVGVPILAAIGDVVDWRAALLVAGSVTFGAALLGLAWLPRDAPRARNPFQLADVLAAYHPLLGHTATLRLMAASLLRAICWYGMLTYLGAFLSTKLAFSADRIGLVYMLAGIGYLLGSLAVSGPLRHVPFRTLLVAGNIVMAVLMGLAFSAVLGPLGSVVMLTLAGFAGSCGWVAVAGLLTAGSPAGAGTTMTLHGSLFNIGAAGGGIIGGLLIAAAGYEALALGVPLFGLASAALAWQPVRA